MKIYGKNVFEMLGTVDLVIEESLCILRSPRIVLEPLVAITLKMSSSFKVILFFFFLFSKTLMTEKYLEIYCNKSAPIS